MLKGAKGCADASAATPRSMGKIKYRKQSRPERVKCQLDGELPVGRKDTNLAVSGPHPAAIG